MAEVELERERRDDEERERREEREAVRRLDGLHVEDALERREDERARDEAGDERVEDDQDAPLELDLVGVHVPLDARGECLLPSPYLTDPSRAL